MVKAEQYLDSMMTLDYLILDGVIETKLIQKNIIVNTFDDKSTLEIYLSSNELKCFSNEAGYIKSKTLKN